MSSYKDLPTDQENPLFISDQYIWNDTEHFEFSLAYFRSECDNMWVYCNL